jgi:hypothetical protein
LRKNGSNQLLRQTSDAHTTAYNTEEQSTAIPSTLITNSLIFPPQMTFSLEEKERKQQTETEERIK